jgi:hypothetical protein
MRLLSIDWDYFFPVPNPIDDKEYLYDWSHSETVHPDLMANGIWLIRAAQFVAQKRDLPTTSGEESSFWDRFRFGQAPVLFYADSHSRIYKPEVSHKVREIWNFDAHHDAYESVSDVIEHRTVSAQNWATAFRMSNIEIWTYYPQWAGWMMQDKPHVEVHPQVDPGHHFRRKFDKVFVCRSGAWTPSWVEDKFWQFIESCPIATKVKLDGMTPRKFDPAQARRIANDIPRRAA